MQTSYHESTSRFSIKALKRNWPNALFITLEPSPVKTL